jgi:hypothetical protein
MDRRQGREKGHRRPEEAGEFRLRIEAATREHRRVTLRGLLFIALRFYAIYFFSSFLPALPIFIAFFRQISGEGMIGLLTPLCWIAVAGILWCAAGPLATRMTRELNPPVQFNVNLEGAYAFAFVMLGLYFALNSSSALLLHLFSLVQVIGTERSDDMARTRAITVFLPSAITFVAGLASLLGAPAWARKLARRSRPAE